MDVDGFLKEIQSSPAYRDQIVHVHEVPARKAVYARAEPALSEGTRRMLAGLGVERMYSHQAEAISAALEGRDVLIVTGTASGKSLCYVAPIVEMLRADSAGRALLLFPMKALCQDQFRAFRAALDAAGAGDVLAGVFDGDTPSATRRKLRDGGSVVFSNPDMIHSAMMAQHGRWAKFLAGLKYLVLDELHVYNGIFGSNMANLLRRFQRLCEHYGSRPQIIACSATIANPLELAERLTGRRMTLIDRDGSPRGRRVYVFWNPPRIRGTTWRSRRSANVEAHELMAELVRRGAPTITFCKAKMTAEMVHRYVCEALRKTAPHLASKVTPYRGGYRPEERREIERRLFAGELLGVSCTRALELGIDVGALEACIVVGHPGTLASFFQQSGRAGRGEEDTLIVLVGLDTSVNQYVMSHPEYLFGRPVEQAVVDPDNPFVITNHLRCAAHEMPLPADEAGRFGSQAGLVLSVLQENRKVRRIKGRWYHAAAETPQHETSLRDTADRNVIIEDADTGDVLGQVNKFDAPPILHPEAIYFHRGQTYRVLELDIERKYIARVKREEVDYYTQPIGGTDVHHVDARLREKPFGTGMAFWGEVTAYFRNLLYEKIRFYELDAISVHPVELPIFQLETMAVWLVPPEELMERVRRAGLDAHAGLRGVGYATRMLLPLFITCDTLSFSHTIGSVNSPWNAIFIYERHPYGLGFTRKAYEQLHRILPAVLDNLRTCPCDDGCPCCTGKPLRQYATWDVQRGEASIPSKAAARMILEGLLGDGSRLDCPDTHALSDDEQAGVLQLAEALRRRLERMREPELFHPIKPQPEVKTEAPPAEDTETLETPDVDRRIERRRDFHKDLRKRLAKKLGLGGLPPDGAPPAPPKGMKRGGVVKPTAFPGRPAGQQPGPAEPPPEPPADDAEEPSPPTMHLGSSLAARAKRLKKKREEGG
ncbi:MAG TPA: DEAD/DEAH box helicase [Phycisphaerae bacterium]|nr:DEAD/DEAH box helicase [Phycisphaerae bacterium]